MNAYRADDPPINIAVSCCQYLLEKHPARIAFVGRAGAGKGTLAEVITTGKNWPVFNHSDRLKEEVLDWLSDALHLGFDPDSDLAFNHFADFMGISVARIQDSMWDMLGPVYAEMIKLYLTARRKHFRLTFDIDDTVGKVAFVDQNKADFRSSLQKYGEVSREIAADETYWAQMTIDRSVGYPICFNADTRNFAEVQYLRSCGWSTIYLYVDDETQRKRRPDMTEDQRSHQTEWAVSPDDCDFVIDSSRPLSQTVMQLTDYLGRTFR